jgi:hypothetical protein
VQLRALLDEVLQRCADPDAVLAALDDIRVALDRRWTERVADAAAIGAARRDGSR